MQEKLTQPLGTRDQNYVFFVVVLKLCSQRHLVENDGWGRKMQDRLTSLLRNLLFLHSGWKEKDSNYFKYFFNGFFFKNQKQKKNHANTCDVTCFVLGWCTLYLLVSNFWGFVSWKIISSLLQFYENRKWK